MKNLKKKNPSYKKKLKNHSIIRKVLLQKLKILLNKRKQN